MITIPLILLCGFVGMPSHFYSDPGNGRLITTLDQLAASARPTTSLEDKISTALSRIRLRFGTVSCSVSHLLQTLLPPPSLR